MQTKAATDPLDFLNAAIRNMEAAGGYPLKTREPLERLSADMWRRALEGFCVRDEVVVIPRHDRSPASE